MTDSELIIEAQNSGALAQELASRLEERCWNDPSQNKTVVSKIPPDAITYIQKKLRA
tara:strand:- start:6535 stop:6705 length:171 start_codon:yes stop_codon:yes gene_type:complete